MRSTRVSMVRGAGFQPQAARLLLSGAHSRAALAPGRALAAAATRRACGVRAAPSRQRAIPLIHTPPGPTTHSPALVRRRYDDYVPQRDHIRYVTGGVTRSPRAAGAARARPLTPYPCSRRPAGDETASTLRSTSLPLTPPTLADGAYRTPMPCPAGNTTYCIKMSVLPPWDSTAVMRDLADPSVWRDLFSVMNATTDGAPLKFTVEGLANRLGRKDQHFGKLMAAYYTYGILQARLHKGAGGVDIWPGGWGRGARARVRGVLEGGEGWRDVTGR